MLLGRSMEKKDQQKGNVISLRFARQHADNPQSQTSRRKGCLNKKSLSRLKEDPAEKAEGTTSEERLRMCVLTASYLEAEKNLRSPRDADRKEVDIGLLGAAAYLVGEAFDALSLCGDGKRKEGELLELSNAFDLVGDFLSSVKQSIFTKRKKTAHEHVLDEKYSTAAYALQAIALKRGDQVEIITDRKMAMDRMFKTVCRRIDEKEGQ